MDNMEVTGSYGNEETSPQPAYPKLPDVDDDEEWQYPMRRTMQEIIPGLFLGPYAAASRNNLSAMIEAGLTHVVCVRAKVEAHLIRPNHPNNFEYLTLDMDDSPLELIIPKLKEVTEFIDKCLNSNGKVLVHGNAGMSRSACLVVGYIMSKFGVNFKKASKYVQTKRFCICVKESFASQLREYEPIYLAMHSTPLVSLGGISGAQFETLKRTIDEILDDEDNVTPAMRTRLDTAGTAQSESAMELEKNGTTQSRSATESDTHETSQPENAMDLD